MVAGLVLGGCQGHSAYLDAAAIAKPAVAEMVPPKPTRETIVVQRPILPFLGGEEPPREPTIQDTVAAALAKIGVDAIPALVSALDDPDASARTAAGHALALMGPKAADAVPALIVHLSDADENVRRTVARALGQIGPAARDAIPELIALLKHPGSAAPKAKAPPKTPAGAKPTTPAPGAPKL